jgi:hypothetical protein
LRQGFGAELTQIDRLVCSEGCNVKLRLEFAEKREDAVVTSMAGRSDGDKQAGMCRGEVGGGCGQVCAGCGGEEVMYKSGRVVEEAVCGIGEKVAGRTRRDVGG